MKKKKNFFKLFMCFYILFWKIQQLINFTFYCDVSCVSTVMKPLLPGRAENGDDIPEFSDHAPSFHNRHPEIN